jgi:hypothetical protein
VTTPLGEKTILIRADGNAIKPLCRCFALRDFLFGAAYQLQQSGLVLARHRRSLHRQQRQA